MMRSGKALIRIPVPQGPPSVGGLAFWSVRRFRLIIPASGYFHVVFIEPTARRVAENDVLAKGGKRRCTPGACGMPRDRQPVAGRHDWQRKPIPTPAGNRILPNLPAYGRSRSPADVGFVTQLSPSVPRAGIEYVDTRLRSPDGGRSDWKTGATTTGFCMWSAMHPRRSSDPATVHSCSGSACIRILAAMRPGRH